MDSKRSSRPHTSRNYKLNLLTQSSYVSNDIPLTTRTVISHKSRNTNELQYQHRKFKSLNNINDKIKTHCNGFTFNKSENVFTDNSQPFLGQYSLFKEKIIIRGYSNNNNNNNTHFNSVNNKKRIYTPIKMNNALPQQFMLINKSNTLYKANANKDKKRNVRKLYVKQHVNNKSEVPKFHKVRSWESGDDVANKMDDSVIINQVKRRFSEREINLFSNPESKMYYIFKYAKYLFRQKTFEHNTRNNPVLRRQRLENEIKQANSKVKDMLSSLKQLRIINDDIISKKYHTNQQTFFDKKIKME